MAKELSKIVVPAAAAKTGGALQSFVWDAIVQGNKVRFAGGNVILIGDSLENQPDFEEVRTIVTQGGSFEGIKLGLEFTIGGAGLTVPAVVPGSTYTDDNGETQTRTWLQWAQSQANLEIYKKAGEQLYIIKGQYNGKLLNSAALAAAHVQNGVNVIEWSVFTFRLGSGDWAKL